MKDFQLSTFNFQLNIGWLYPELMSTYGDKGNIIALRRRCEWRGIDIKIVPIHQSTTTHELHALDLIFGGGSQDREQEIVMRDLKGKKQKIIKNLIDKGIPALFVCGAPQLLGKYYEPAVGQRIEGLGIFDMETVNPGPDVPRCIGNTIAKVLWQNLEVSRGAASIQHPMLTSIDTSENISTFNTQLSTLIVGFENHGGRTYLGKSAKPFAKIIKGFGNNGKDGTEGVVYKNAIGCYFHGPLLPKNPHIADYLIQKALEVKYNKQITLSLLDDSLEIKAHQMIVKRLGIKL